VRLVEQLDLPELTCKQVEQLSLIAEEAARKHVISKLSPKKMETLNVSAEAEGTKPVTLKVEVDIVLAAPMKDLNVQRLADDAVREAFKSAEKFLRGLKCRSST
jgi:hypothetical protein